MVAAVVVVALALLGFAGCAWNDDRSDAEETLDRAPTLYTLGYPDGSAVRLQIRVLMTDEVRGCDHIDVGIDELENWDTEVDDEGNEIVTIRVGAYADTCS